LVYDIETTQFPEGKDKIPIDIIGYSDFEVSFESEKELVNFVSSTKGSIGYVSPATSTDGVKTITISDM